MDRIAEAKLILRALGLPKKQQNDTAAYTLVAFAEVGPADGWDTAQAIRTNPHGVIQFCEAAYDKRYAENSRETIRRQAIHQFVHAAVLTRNPDDPGLATNSPKTHYALTAEALTVIRAFGEPEFAKLAERFRHQQGELVEVYRRPRMLKMVPVQLPDGSKLMLSPGQHNKLHKAVVEEFLPRFGPGAQILYLGDTDQKGLHVEEETLARLGVPVTQHDKLPDVVAYMPDREWLFLIEAVTSHGPVGPKRYRELEDALAECKAGRVYVTAFPDFKKFKRFASAIAWETEVWIADAPDHLLHYNGDRFFGPR